MVAAPAANKLWAAGLSCFCLLHRSSQASPPRKQRRFPVGLEGSMSSTDRSWPADLRNEEVTPEAREAEKADGPKQSRPISPACKRG